MFLESTTAPPPRKRRVAEVGPLPPRQCGSGRPAGLRAQQQPLELFSCVQQAYWNNAFLNYCEFIFAIWWWTLELFCCVQQAYWNNCFLNFWVLSLPSGGEFWNYSLVCSKPTGTTVSWITGSWSKFQTFLWPSPSSVSSLPPHTTSCGKQSTNIMSWNVLIAYLISRVAGPQSTNAFQIELFYLKSLDPDPKPWLWLTHSFSKMYKMFTIAL